MEIRRDIIDTLRRWKRETGGEPILLKGTGQIGKIWAMEMFGKEEFDYCTKFDFDRQPELRPVFQTSKSPERILKELSLYTEVPTVTGETLIIFDEVQGYERTSNSLKYLYEDMPAYHVIAAGNLLGMVVKRCDMTMPVGKVSIMRMYPITFREFLHAADEETFSYIKNSHDASRLPEIILNKLKAEYRRYFVCGGILEAVISLPGNKGMEAAEKAQQDVLDLYELDFAKYATPRKILRIYAIWRSLPSQLVKESRKFIFKIVKPGARSKDYEGTLLWLEGAGMAYRVFDTTKPGLPILAYVDPLAFKVYACGCELLHRLAQLPVTVILDTNVNYTEFKDNMTENAIL